MKWLFSTICMFLIVFVFAVFAPIASAFEVNTASVGLTTASMEFSEHTTGSLYEGLTVDAEFDVTLASDVFMLGSIVTDTQVRYAGVDLNAPGDFTGRYVNWRVGLYVQPLPWLRIGSILSQDEFDRTFQTEYAIRIGKHF